MTFFAPGHNIKDRHHDSRHESDCLGRRSPFVDAIPKRSRVFLSRLVSIDCNRGEEISWSHNHDHYILLLTADSHNISYGTEVDSLRVSINFT